MGKIALPRVLNKRSNRKRCIEIDGCCKSCGSTENLTPHHILHGMWKVGDYLWNLITLCWHCHRNLHDGKDKDGNFVGEKTVIMNILKRLKGRTGFRWMEAFEFLEQINEN